MNPTGDEPLFKSGDILIRRKDILFLLDEQTKEKIRCIYLNSRNGFKFWKRKDISSGWRKLE